MWTGAVYRESAAAHGIPEILGASAAVARLTPEEAECEVPRCRCNDAEASSVANDANGESFEVTPPCEAAAAAIARNFCSIHDLPNNEFLPS